MENDPAISPSEVDAIVFIPGLTTEFISQDLNQVAGKIAAAIDKSANTREATFSIIEERDQVFGQQRVRMNKIFRHDGTKTRHIIDLYELEYRKEFSQKFRDLSILRKIMEVVYILSSTSRRFSISLFQDTKGRSHKKQLFVAGLFAAVIFIYALMTVVSGIYAIELILENMTGTNIFHNLYRWVKEAFQFVTRGYLPFPTGTTLRSIFTASQAFVLMATTYGLIKKGDLANTLEKGALDLITTFNYIKFGDQKSQLVGQLANIFEYIEEKDTPYRNRMVMGFSFGTLIALDSLFSHGAAIKSFEKVDKVVTIGSPIDLIRMFWPDYFKKRVPPNNKIEWINVYSPLDVLGSDLSNGDRSGKAKVGISFDEDDVPEIIPENILFGDPYITIGLREMLSGKGFQYHVCYWSDSHAEITCFDQTVQLIYKDDYILS